MVRGVSATAPKTQIWQIRVSGGGVLVTHWTLTLLLCPLSFARSKKGFEPHSPRVQRCLRTFATFASGRRCSAVLLLMPQARIAAKLESAPVLLVET